ncbi:MAG TPA: hypothetical protein VHH92_05870 [Actinomycetota bacterium]|nr:hypothetical protein [Actinomycetota bacterium]
MDAAHREQRRTRDGRVHGPEYLRGDGADPRSDLYSLGAVLYELLVGRPPFTGDSPLQVAYRHLEEAPAPPASINSEIPPALSAVVMRCLAKHPGDRYRRAEELATDLHRLRNGLPAATAPVPGPRTGVLHRPPPAEPAPPRRRRARWAIAGAVVAALAVAGLFLPLLWPAPADRPRATPRPVRPPADVSAAGRCGGFLAAEVVVRWEPSPSRFADGYDLYRSTESGGQYERVAFVPGRDTTSFTDGAVGLGDTYYYLIRAKAGQRESRPTQVQADTPSVCFF